MSLLTRGTIRNGARRMAIDIATDSPAGTDAEYNSKIDEVTEFLMAFNGPRYTVIGSTEDTGLVLVAATNPYQMKLAQATWDEIVTVYYEDTAAGAKTFSAMLDLVDVDELIYRKETAGFEIGTPAPPPMMCAVIPGQGADKPWVIEVHPPIASGTKYFSAIVRATRTAYVDDNSTADVLPGEDHLIKRIVAYEMAASFGRSVDLLDILAMLIPEHIRTARGIKLHADVGVMSTEEA